MTYGNLIKRKSFGFFSCLICEGVKSNENNKNNKYVFIGVHVWVFDSRKSE